MKKPLLVSFSIFMILVFSFSAINAKVMAQVQNDNSKKLSEIKEIRHSIKLHQKTNEKIEKQIERKSKQVEKILVSLGKSSLVSQQVIEEQLNQKLEVIMTELMQIGEYETASWKHLNAANRQIKAKKYNAGIKNLNLADKNLENKHEALIIFNNELDAFLTFLKSLQYK
jgi:hypothetical protein